MPFITAGKIHNGHGWIPEGTTLEVSETGVIISILDKPGAGTVFYDGALAPGFVNAHCHLELSHMKGVVPEHTGLIPFLKTIPQRRNDFTGEQKKEGRTNAYNELVRNGVVAVGDIANTTDTLDVRATGELHVCTFIESIGFTEANAQRSFDYALKTYEAFFSQQPGDKRLTQAIAPHAPYSVSSSLFRLIDAHVPGGLLSIHNQENEEENKYYKAKEGAVGDLLHTLGIDDSLFSPTGLSSLISYLQWLSPSHSFILVHNTCTTRQEVQYAQNRLKEVHWCLCPNANLYIENTLPDIHMLTSEGVNICIGTDSLASNRRLSILAELSSIKAHYPELDWQTLLTWGTRNGAKALHMDDIIGTIEPGKTPGIIQITGLDNLGEPVVKKLF
jgi:cytosine/adenosine deaminase-related metal-dependent hydrolase